MKITDLRRRAHNARIFGNGGGWVRIGRKSIQGWENVVSWLESVKARLPWNLAEIVDGRRVSVPTLSRKDTLETAAGLLSAGQVSWRD